MFLMEVLLDLSQVDALFRSRDAPIGTLAVWPMLMCEFVRPQLTWDLSCYVLSRRTPTCSKHTGVGIYA